MSHRVHPIPAIIDLLLTEIVDQRRIARIASGAALAAAVHAGLRLPVAWSAEPREASETHFEELARAVPADIDVIYGIGGGLAADAAKYVAWRRSLPLALIPTALSVDAHVSTAHDL